jgi:riboflavin biosynthesis pyrimidine reductase
MWNGLLTQGLVDELHLMVGPAAVGGGTRLLEAPARFALADVRRFEDSDKVLLRYVPAGRRA